MLFNVFISAATGALLFALLRSLGFGQPVAALTALAWGIGTTAWPYACSFFREPLLGLLWLGAAVCCLAWQRTRRAPWALGCLALAAGSLAVKISAAGALPGMAEDDVIEATCLVGSGVVRPFAMGALPEADLGLMKWVNTYERLTIQAAVENSYPLALKALTIHPLVPGFDIARDILDDYLAQHGDYFPNLQS